MNCSCSCSSACCGVDGSHGAAPFIPRQPRCLCCPSFHGRIDDHAIEVFRKKLRDHDYAIYLPRYPNPDAEAKALLKEFAELAGIEG